MGVEGYEGPIPTVQMRMLIWAFLRCSLEDILKRLVGGRGSGILKNCEFCSYYKSEKKVHFLADK